MDKKIEHALNRNIWVYGLMKIFTKRVFLPLTAIYLVEVGSVTVPQIAFLATVSAVVAIFAEVPTGYFADRITRRASLFMSAGILTLMSIVLAVWPSFMGALLAVILESVGYAFLTGAGEALMHDTLVKQRREKEYTKIVARAQAIGLFGNIILVSLVGLTYQINPRLPFWCGVVAYCALFGLTAMLYEPERVRSQFQKNPLKDLAVSLRSFVNRYTVLIFVSVGILSGLYNGTSDFTNLIFNALGMPPGYLGVVFSAASALAIVISLNAGFLRKLPFKYYQLLDFVLCVGFILGIGLSKSLYFMVPAFIVQMGFWRLRMIVYQHQLLDVFPTVKNKATLLSTLSFFGRANEVWVPVVFGIAIQSSGYFNSYTSIGLAAALTLPPLIFVAHKKLGQHTVLTKEV